MSGKRYLFPPFILDTSNECLLCVSKKIALRPKSLALLRNLVEHANSLRTKEELIRAVWSGAKIVDAAIKVSIGEIRNALGDVADSPRYIETVGRSGYRFIAPVSVAFSSDSSSTSPVHVVGRETELQFLRLHFEKADSGKRQMVFVTGEPGIGKTTLIELFSHSLAGQNGVAIAHGQSIELYGAGEAYLPILDALERLCRDRTDQQLTDMLRRIAPSWSANLSSLLSTDERLELQRQAIGITPERRLREIGVFLEEIARDQTLLIILEDLHWLDPSSLALISYLARRPEAARLMVIGTYRAGEVERRNHPLKAAATELELHNLCAQLPLKALSRDRVNEYLAARFETPSVSDSVLSTVYGRSEGNPLFMVNVTDYLVSREAIIRERDSITLTGIRTQDAVPGTIRDLIYRQVNALSHEEQELLEAASVAGTTFPVSLVARVLGRAREVVEEQCRELSAREQFLQYSGLRRTPSGSSTALYKFSHALFHEVIYNRVGDMRKARMHQSIGERLEAVYRGATEPVAAELALHFERSGDYNRAVQYLVQTAQRAVRQNTYQEAYNYCTRGKELIKPLQESSERKETELSLELLAGVSLASLKGYAAIEAREAFSAAESLSRNIGNKSLLFQTLAGLWSFELIRGELRSALNLAKRKMTLASALRDSGCLVEAHMSMGISLFYTGAFLSSRDHLKNCLDLYDIRKHTYLTSLYGWDPAVVSLCYLPSAVWILGEPDSEIKSPNDALTLADKLGYPVNEAFARTLIATHYNLRGESGLARDLAHSAITLSTEQGFAHWRAGAMTIYGWALLGQGEVTEGINNIREGLQYWRGTGAGLEIPRYLCCLAEAYGRLSDQRKALSKITEAFTVSKQSGERFYDAEICRIRGEILAKGKRAGIEEAEDCFMKAIEISRRQKAKSFELRAVVSLSRVWQKMGKVKEAHKTLAKIHSWFDGGFQTLDLQAAKKLLSQLS